MTENRCWPGYEPVKGKKKSDQGSCRPKAESKETGAEKQFRAKRKKQLDNSKTEQSKTSRATAQHLKSPTAKAKAKKTKPEK